MDQICLVVPILPGKTPAARDFMRELEGDRKPGYQHSERRIGIVKEAWYLARTPAGDQLVVYMESPDFPKALSMFSGSQAWPPHPVLGADQCKPLTCRKPPAHR